MEFNVSFSKRKNAERFYLPGQEIKFSHGIISQKNFTAEGDSVSMCRSRIWLILAAFAVFYAILGLRVTCVCLGNGINIDAALVDNNTAEENILHLKNPVKRADIMDRNGEIIATSLPTVNLSAKPTLIKNPEEVAAKLSAIFPDVTYERFVDLLSRKKKFVYLKRNLSPAQQSQVNALGVPGLEFENCEKRIYPHENLFAHILGNTNVDNQGISGLESFMDDRLTTSTKPVKLSVDMGIQNTIREELKAGMEHFKAEGAAAILMNVNTGQIVAMTSVPDFNPNDNIKVADRAMFNFATKGVYEAGSVFKVFNTAMCLDSGKIDVNSRFDTSKPVYFGRYRVSDPHGSHKMLTPEDILVESSNIGSTLEVMQVGKQYQRAFFQKINMDKSLSDFEVTETAKPLFLSEKCWSEHSMATISYGYGISTTPLHIISAFSAIVNGGIYHEPTLLAETKDNGRRVVSQQTSEKMRTLLRAVVVRGTGRRANVEGYQVFGKTGTADKLVNGRYDHKKSISTFISGFPASNPKYALLVVFDDPKGLKETFNHTEAGWNAVPTTKNIITAVAPQLNIKVDFDLEKQKSIVDAAYKKKK